MPHFVRPSVPLSKQFVLDDCLQVVALSDAVHGKEVVPHERSSEFQKQIVFSNEEKEPAEALDWQGQRSAGLSARNSRHPQRSKKSRCLITVLVVLLIIILAITATVISVLEVRKRQSSQNLSGSPTSPSNPQATGTSTAGSLPTQTPTGEANHTTTGNSSNPLLSTYGAFNGSGLMSMDPSDGTDQLLLFYQHFNGL
ncbi:hypothetical protein MMC26_005147 [Xylographa opegraphella]|nr:hypothetical protein [Xylographa opegraphella]